MRTFSEDRPGRFLSEQLDRGLSNWVWFSRRANEYSGIGVAIAGQSSSDTL